MVDMLVCDLGGKHWTMTIAQGTQVFQVCFELAERTGLPVGAFYLTRQSKILHSGDLLWMGKDERLVMQGRLRGGMDGDWTCQHCGRQGCWVTKVRCYMCGKSKEVRSAEPANSGCQWECAWVGQNPGSAAN